MWKPKSCPVSVRHAKAAARPSASSSAAARSRRSRGVSWGPAARAAPPQDTPRDRLLRAAALLLALGLAAAFAWRTETGHDFGFHIATGREILKHHAWPRVDEFTYTVAGRPYIDMHG